MKVCELIERYGISKILKSTSGLEEDSLSFFGMIDRALTHIYETHARGQEKYSSRMIRTQAFPNDGRETQHLQTKFPILKIANIYCGKLPEYPKPSDECCSPTCNCQYCTDCYCYNGEPLNLRKLTPGGKPKPNSYQVSGGHLSNIVTLHLAEDCCLCNNTCNTLEEGAYVEYYAGWNCIECLDDELPIPKQMLPILADYIKHEILSEGIDNTAQRAADYLAKAKNSTYASKDQDEENVGEEQEVAFIFAPPIKGTDCSGFHYMNY